MNELLWKENTPKLPLAEQVYCELALEDATESSESPYVVRRTYYSWSEEQRRMAPADRVIDRAYTLEEADARYAQQRQILAEQGFVHSDMDPML